MYSSTLRTRWPSLRRYKSFQRIPNVLKGLQSSSALFATQRFQSDMHFSHSFVLAILPFLTAALPQAQPPASRGIAIPIAKRTNGLPLADPSRFESLNQNTIA